MEEGSLGVSGSSNACPHLQVAVFYNDPMQKHKNEFNQLCLTEQEVEGFQISFRTNKERKKV
jgi:hypothetical protein